MGHSSSNLNPLSLAVALAIAMVPASQAGDILRGGSAAATTNAPSATSGTATAQAAKAQANASDALARTSAALQSVRAMQASARKVALAGPNNLGKNPSFPGQILPNVPNGLVIGGLQVAPGVPINLSTPTSSENPALWTGAKLPTQTVSGGKTKVTIVQTQSQALLNWKTFNIGKKTAVTFDQKAGGKDASKWIAFNQITDPSGNPTQILGSLDAIGQVYLISTNGIIFGGSSQINTRSFTASSLPINTNLINQGLLNNRDAQFLFSALPIVGGATGTPAFNPTVSDPSFIPNAGNPTYNFQQTVALTGTKLTAAPNLSYRTAGGIQKLSVDTDFSIAVDSASGKASITFTQVGLNKIQGAAVTASYTPAVAPTGDVVVQGGTLISSPLSSDGNGGRVLLVGANVTNSGTIQTPGGQTILASGLQVGIASHATTDPSLRGLDVSVGKVDDHSGVTTNTGLISSERASIVLTGKSIDQNGVVSSTTSVGLNGRIDLAANFNAISNAAYDPIKRPDNPPFLFTETGVVTLGPNSIVEVLPEIKSTQTIASTALPLKSQINLLGKVIHLEKYALILAPNAQVSLQAGLWDYQSSQGLQSAKFVFSSSQSPVIAPQIFLDSDATINVAGTAGASVSINENILSVDVRGSELADSPLQRTGPIRGKTLAVDLRIHGPWDPTLNDGAGDYTWVGTPLADARGYRNLIERSVGELTVGGGSIELHAGGSVVLQDGSLLDVSGGSIDYQGGIVQTTRVLSGSQLLDISQATPDRVYSGLYTGQFSNTYAKYGLAEVFTHALALTDSHYEPGYTEGAAGGSIKITAPAVALDGKLLGNTVAGSHQQSDGPAPSSFALSFQQQDTNIQHFSFSPTPPTVIFQESQSASTAQQFALDSSGNPLSITADREELVQLSSDLLTTAGFGKLTVENSDGSIIVPEGVTLNAAAGNGVGQSSISLTAANLTIDGNISAPGGSLTFVTYDVTPFRSHYFPPSDVVPPDPTVDLTRGIFTLGSMAMLNTAGLITDDRLNRYNLENRKLVTNGGTISINAFTAQLSTDSIIDVSGGIAIDGSGQRTYGKGGSISIKTGQDPKIAALTGGLLTLGSDLKGFSGNQGGNLSIQAPLVQIGGAAPKAEIVTTDGVQTTMLNISGTLVAKDTLLWISPEFFSTGGFQNFTITGLGLPGSAEDEYIPAVSIAPGTNIAPTITNLLATSNTDDSGEVEVIEILLPQAQRKAVGLNFVARGTNDFSGGIAVRGDFVLGENATIETDPFADATRGVTISAQTADILGSIHAPGGLITISGGGTSSTLFKLTGPDRAVATVHLSSQTILSAAGASSIYEDGRGYRTGSVYNGGTIQISGNIVAENGALLDVSGTSDVLDLSPASSQSETDSSSIAINPLYGSLLGSPRVATTVTSSAGSIILQGAQMLYSDATLQATSGGGNSLGGSLTASSSNFFIPEKPQTPLDITLSLQQTGRVLANGVASIGQAVIDAAGPASGGGHLAVSSFASGGFDSITLKGIVAFQVDVSLTANRQLSIGDGGVIYATGNTNLSAPYVALGMEFEKPKTAAEQAQIQSLFTVNGLYYFNPTYGRGRLNVSADLIDIGSLSLQQIGSLNLVASDVRGNGTLDVSGDVRIEANRIYPTTASSFSILAYEKNVVIASSSTITNRVTLASTILPPGLTIGSNLLGSQIVNIDGDTVTLAGNSNANIATNTPVVIKPGSGSVNIASSGTSHLPLSAGGVLSIYASHISQGGNIFAPGGTINLGWNGEGASPHDLITGAGFQENSTATSVPISQTLALLHGSTTSVSLVDPDTGLGVLIPYGLNVNGNRWIDPSGTDITAGGGPQKSISLSSLSIDNRAGSVIDIRGGGDLYSYQWVAGVGGSKDVLNTNSSYAIIPGYDSSYAPYAPYNDSAQSTNLGGDSGYVSTLQAGEKITISGSKGLAAGTYTLLPARYALSPGAYLITPKTGTPLGSISLADGSVLVSGKMTGQSLLQSFEVASSAVVRTRSEYHDFFASSFLRDGAIKNNTTVPRLPQDAGYLLFEASNMLTLQGSVLANGSDGGRGGMIDISSSSDILINGNKSHSISHGIVLSADQLSSFGAESLLIGGKRTVSGGKTTVAVTTDHLTLDNHGSSLSGSDIILVANNALTLSNGSEILASGNLIHSTDRLHLGNSAVLGSGDGLLLRVSNDTNAQIFRDGLSASQSSQPILTIEAGAHVSGAGVILDSSNAFTLNSQANLAGSHVSLDAGQIAIQLDSSPITSSTPGLILAGSVLRNLETTQAISLLSYGSIDIYGSGNFKLDGSLSMRAAAIRGFATNGKIASISAGTITLDNSDHSSLAASSPTGVADGTLRFTSDVLHLGSGNLSIDRFATLDLIASNRVLIDGTGGLETSGAIHGATPLITATGKSKYSIVSSEDITFDHLTSTNSGADGLGASLSLQGSRISLGSDIILHSGSISLSATGSNAADQIFVTGNLDISGTTRTYFDVIRYTSGGDVDLSSQSGDIVLGNQSIVNVSATSGGGNAGILSIHTPQGSLHASGKLLGAAGAGGASGSFSLDTQRLSNTTALDLRLDHGEFSDSRSYRVRLGDILVDSLVNAHAYSLTADAGSIVVGAHGDIDASGKTGGSIRLVAASNVTLQNSSRLSVEGDDFDNAGKGGSISLEAGSGTLANGGYQSGNGVVSIQPGSVLNLGVKTTYNSNGQVDTNKLTAAANLGKFTGTLHLRAPQNASGTDLSVDPIAGTLLGNPGSIVIEGFKIYQPTGGQIENVEGDIFNNASQFTSNTVAISQRIFGAQIPFAAVITPGAEIINATGDLTLSTDWDLSSYRFGPRKAAGVLTMRTAGNLVFNGALSDGFDVNLATEIPVLYAAPLMAYNAQLPANAQSWSYQLSAGSDLTSADFHRVRSLDMLSTNTGSLQLGQAYNRLAPDSENITLIALLEQNAYQVIRTGSGNIDIAVGRDVQLRNPFATIYTAGTQIAEATKVVSAGDFDLPTPRQVSQGALGAYQEPTWAPQYSYAGGNLNISAGRNIRHQTFDGLADSERQLPVNWLYRRGYVATDGRFGKSPFGEIASTTWWVDFSNFFEGVGTLGGGNVILTAGGNVENIDAVVATNSRTVGKNSQGALPAASAQTVELGGGDLTVSAGGNIDAGVYYVEKGHGHLDVGGSILTNATRAPSSAVVTGRPVLSAAATWLPTTLFLGKGSFEISASSNISIGPVVNAFLVPQGVSNNYQYRTYFSTYSEESSVQLTSLSGNIDLHENAYSGSSQPILQNWLKEVSLLQFGSSGRTAAYYEPWIRLAETSLNPFATALSLMPGTFQITAFSGNVNLAGNITLSPSSKGGVEIVAGGAINGLQPIGSNPLANIWDSSTINISDTDPSFLPSITTPLAVQSIPVLAGSSPQETRSLALEPLQALFAESGSSLNTQSLLQTKLALHGNSLLHADDREPVRLYASTGNVADVTVYSPKSARVLAGNDITDIGLYFQNTSDSDISVVSAGRDIVAYNPNAPLLIAAQLNGNSTLSAFNNQNPAQSGDIQISGPGTLEVLAGRNLTLGAGRNTDLAADLSIGISSIGNARNPSLPFAGARILLGAGIGGPAELANSDLDFTSFIDTVVTPANLALYLPELTTAPPELQTSEFASLSKEAQARVALDIFYRILRDAGRSHNDPNDPNFGTYAAGFAAIETLFPQSTGSTNTGDIDLSSRSVKTSQGGDIDMLAPSGGLTLGYNIPGPNEVPPGVITEAGGNISIFTDLSVQVGALRIFTLLGGNEIIWSSHGDIAAGNASKTVKTAPPTRVVLDAQTATVQTDLAGLATGGGIGVLASVIGVPPGNVDLIAPTGTIDAGDAGIRATGNLSIAAVTVLNADNIKVGGTSVGVPNVVAPSVNLAGLASANTSAAAGTQAASDVAKQNQASNGQAETPSLITVEVLGYGGSEFFVIAL